METDKPHLTLVDDDYPVPGAGSEFLPLPFYSWDERPPTLPLDHDEVATAIHLSNGDLVQASRLLKCPLIRVTRSLRASPRLQRVLSEAHEQTVQRAASEMIVALSSDSDRRREWAASKILASRIASTHAFAPAPPSTAQSASLSLSATQSGTKILTFRWRTDADDIPEPA